MNIPLGPSRRRAVAGVLAALFLFLMIFTAGLGFFLYQNQANLQKYQADAADLSARGQTNLERLSLYPTLKSSNLLVEVNNTGGTVSTVEAAYVKDGTGKIIWGPEVLGPIGWTNRSNPLTLAISEHGGVLTNYTYGGSPVYVSILTARGNIFSQRYPLSIVGNDTTISTTTTVTSTEQVGAVGNPLVVVMIATPSQVFSGHVVTLNVTFYNFGTLPITNPAFNPAAPVYFLTGTATLTPLGCGPFSAPSIPGYSGVGTPPHIYKLCTYTAHTGTTGGVASFAGGGKATYNGTTIFSAEASSNLIQIGGITDALLYGAFTINFFEFKFTSCTNGPALNGSGSIFNRYPMLPYTCTTNPPPANWVTLPSASNVSASHNFYTAFYIQVTNNFNSSLVLMQYTMMQLDQSDGGESDWWLAGNSNMLTNSTALVYYPNYSSGGLPTLAAYPNNCNSGPPTPAGCFALGPGQSQVLTFAACSFSSSNWDWGGVPNGDHFDVKSGCVSSWPLFQYVYGHGSASVATLVISFYYKGHIFTQNIAFEGIGVQQ